MGIRGLAKIRLIKNAGAATAPLTVLPAVRSKTDKLQYPLKEKIKKKIYDHILFSEVPRLETAEGTNLITGRDITLLWRDEENTGPIVFVDGVMFPEGCWSVPFHDFYKNGEFSTIFNMRDILELFQKLGAKSLRQLNVGAESTVNAEMYFAEEESCNPKGVSYLLDEANKKLVVVRNEKYDQTPENTYYGQANDVDVYDWREKNHWDLSATAAIATGLTQELESLAVWDTDKCYQALYRNGFQIIVNQSPNDEYGSHHRELNTFLEKFGFPTVHEYVAKGSNGDIRDLMAAFPQIENEYGTGLLECFFELTPSIRVKLQ